jgi:hypothetical protein
MLLKNGNPARKIKTEISQMATSRLKFKSGYSEMVIITDDYHTN